MNKQKLFEELLKKKGIQTLGGPVLKKRDDPGPFKLSFAQRRIWFLQQFDPGSAAYNDPTALRIKGPLNISTLELTLNEIVRRHRVIQMNFPAKEGQPTQVFKKIEHLIITVLDLQTGTDVEKQIRDFVNHFSRQPFDLADAPLIRAGLLRIATDDYALVVSIHHIVMDGWSKGIMLKELISLYEAFNQGKPSPLGELPIQYTDYVQWLHEWMQGQLYETQLAYWRTALAGSPTMLELPTDHPRPNMLSGKGSVQPFYIQGDKLQELNTLARRENVTLFMLLMAVYNTLLFRYSGQEDILIGIPIAGRHRIELEGLIGLFVNTLVIRTDLSRNPTFEILLLGVRSAFSEAYKYQDIPFERLVEELNPQRNLGVTPLFQVMFQLQNAPMPAISISDLTIIPIQIDTGFSQMDLSLTMWEEAGGMKGTFEYSTDLFEVDTIRRITAHFQALLDAVLSSVDQAISQLPMLSEEEKQHLLVHWNDTDCDYPADICIYRLFEICVEKNPNETAVIFENRQLTYTELNCQANQLAHLLHEMNVGTETLVGICMENSLDLIVGVMGILKTGGAYIPMDPTYPDGRLMSILKDACSTVLITATTELSRFEWYGKRIVCLDNEKDFISGKSDNNCLNGCCAENAACVIYTSGSSGEPKGILIDNRNIVNLVYSFIRSYSPGPGDRILPLTSIASASFVGEILPILTSGGAIFLADRVSFLDIKKLKLLISTQDITILSTVPSMIARLNSAEWRPGKLRLLLSGGEALSAGDIDHLIEAITIVNGYGLTEATVCSTYTIVNEMGLNFSKYPIIPVGKPIINTKVYILDRYYNVVPIGVPGEMYIGGEGISRGYLNNPELTAEKFIKNKNRSYKSYKTYILFKTGDLGSWQSDGSIKFLGRIDTQVQVHGHRIELSEIETYLGLHPAIADVAVVVREIVPGDRRLVAYVVVGSGQKVGSNELREWIGRRVPEYMIPAFIVFIDAMPLTTNGKVDIAALPILYNVRQDLEVKYKAPQTEIEQVIASVWMEYLHLEKVGINDNFFDLGGHSLLLTQVHSRLSEIYDRELTIVDLFRYPTIYSLAGHIGNNQKPELQPESVFKRSQDRGNKQRQTFNNNRFKQAQKLRIS
ncbi:MAG: hypothetical protein QG657_650 [Acidobacteriota bacterium]|nr:hypothetical protein [Acidobacteriota bacterium]